MVKTKQDRKITQSPYYYMVNSISCFVNTHNAGEVFFFCFFLQTEQMSLEAESQRQVAGL